MRDPDDRYEPDLETGWCAGCGQECRVVAVDYGIGSYECHGRKGIHRDIQPGSSCCGDEVLDMDPANESP